MQTLVSLTNDFYNKEAQSFSDTRTRPWDGWVYAMDYLRKYDLSLFSNNNASCAQTNLCDCIDVACGNLRFLDFLINYLHNNKGYSNVGTEAHYLTLA